MEKRGRGRPPKSGGKPMGERLEIRIDAATLAAYDVAAGAAGLDRSDWIRATLNAASQKPLRSKPRGSTKATGPVGD